MFEEHRSCIRDYNWEENLLIITLMKHVGLTLCMLFDFQICKGLPIVVLSKLILLAFFVCLFVVVIYDLLIRMCAY